MSSIKPAAIELCRLCLTDEGVSFPIFDVGAANLAQKILECTSIKVTLLTNNNPFTTYHLKIQLLLFNKNKLDLYISVLDFR